MMMVKKRSISDISRYKIECKELEVSYILKIDINYDIDHGQTLVVEIDKTTEYKSCYFSGMDDRLSFEFHKISPNTTDMIMYTSGDSIYLHLLKNTFIWGMSKKRKKKANKL